MMENNQKPEWKKLQHEFFLKKTKEFEEQVLKEHPEAKLVFPHEGHRRLFDGNVMIYDAVCNGDPAIDFSFYSKDEVHHWKNEQIDVGKNIREVTYDVRNSDPLRQDKIEEPLTYRCVFDQTYGKDVTEVICSRREKLDGEGKPYLEFERRPDYSRYYELDPNGKPYLSNEIITKDGNDYQRSYKLDSQNKPYLSEEKIHMEDGSLYFRHYKLDSEGESKVESIHGRTKDSEGHVINSDNHPDELDVLIKAGMTKLRAYFDEKKANTAVSKAKVAQPNVSQKGGLEL